MGGDLRRTPTCHSEHARGMGMKLPAHRDGQIRVDRLSNEVVPEPHSILHLHEEAGGPPLVERRQQVGGRAAQHEREVGHGEHRTEHRSEPEDVERIPREVAKASQDCIAEGSEAHRLLGSLHLFAGTELGRLERQRRIP